MRTDEGVRLRGYDGFSRASRATPFVPEGPAVWEMSTEQKIESKANDDYSKRTTDPLEIQRKETTFVFVTPRSWPGKEKWAAEKQAEGAWANVVAYDVDDIDQAFDRAIAAHVWFSELVGLPAHGAQSVTQWWQRFSALSSPPLSPKLILAGRADEASALIRILEGPAQVSSVSAHNEEELLAFVAAVVLSIPNADRVPVLNSRCIIFKDPTTLQRLEHSPTSLVLVPYYDELRREARLVESHHVLIRSEDGGSAAVHVPPIDLLAFQGVLVEETGIGQDEALELARLARRSLYAFQRATPTPQTSPPDWVSELRSPVVRRVWLVARWDERRSGDTQALGDLFGLPYAQAREELIRVSRGADPLLVQVGDSWTVTSLEDAWRFGNGHMEAPDLSSYEGIIQSVLGAVDPRLELPVSDRWAAAVYGKTPIHSSDLRRGVAEMLALMGARGEEISIGATTIQSWLYSVLNRLFARLNEDSTGHLWASLTDVLPLLAEAAPDVFLRSVHDGHQGEQPLLQMMFADIEGGNTFSISSPHTGLLWALEGLAWSSEHFGEVVEELARLSEVDPGGALSNRPSASLASIFRPWSPQTSVNSGRRLATLDAIRVRHPKVAWELLLSMLPEHHATGIQSYKTKYRNWQTAPTSITREGLQDMYVEVAERVVEDAGTDTERWVQLVDRLDDLPPPVLPEALSALQAVASGEESLELRNQVWRQLQDLVMKHRRYAHTPWSLKPEQLDLLDELQQSLAPSDPTELVRWLFDDHMPNIQVEKSEDFDADAFREELARRRVEAVRSVADQDGTEGVLRLAAKVELPWFVGEAVGKAGLDETGAQIIEHIDADDELTSAAKAWAAQSARTLGWEWVSGKFAALNGRPLAQARVLLASPDIPRAWDTAEKDSSVDSAYWSEFAPFGRGSNFKLANRSIRQLLLHDRPRAALMMANLSIGHVEIDRSLVVEALERLVTMPSDHPDQVRVDSHEIERLLNNVRTENVDEERLMVLEWQLRPALGFDANSPVLERRLARDPAFFVELVTLSFGPRDGEAESNTPEHVATNAYGLLDEWRVVPGSDGPGEPVDPRLLNQWVDQAATLLKAVDREEVGLEFIGRVLANTVSDPDGAWPTRPVRDLIERISRTELEGGFQVEVLNSRGSTSRGLSEGGDQERELAATYQDLAQMVGDGWPRTAASLRSIAASFTAWARAHDEQATRFLEGFDR